MSIDWWGALGLALMVLSAIVTGIILWAVLVLALVVL